MVKRKESSSRKSVLQNNVQALLDRMDQEQPEIVHIIEQMRLSQEQYEKAMVAMASANQRPQNTNATARSEVNYGHNQ
ncbi:MAG: hypothetical protein KGJ80_07480 [Chloroflexota bacterium]|nr:hypothetical protein [Chloroflexota bacterium]